MHFQHTQKTRTIFTVKCGDSEQTICNYAQKYSYCAVFSIKLHIVLIVDIDNKYVRKHGPYLS